MPEIALLADTGRPTGSASSRRLRREGRIPAVLYGHGIDPQSVTVDAKALRTALNAEAGLNALISLEVGGTRHLAMARQLQKNPVRGTVDHVDFVIVRRDEVVATEVPVRLVGEALEVSRGDGLVEQQLFSLLIHARPADIPNGIDVDVTNLVIGESIKVADLNLPEGVTTEVDPEDTVVAGQASRVAADVAEAGEAEAASKPAEAAVPGAGGEESADSKDS